MLNLQPPAEGAAQTAEGAREGFNAGDLIIEHVSNTSVDHPLIQLPRVFGIDMSVTKHVFMLWVVAAILFFGLTWLVRRYLAQERLVPGRTESLLEIALECVRDSIAAPNLGHKWVLAWTPLLLTLFLFIFTCNLMGVLPVFDVLELLNSTVVHARAARRRHRDRQLQRHRGAGHRRLLLHHRRRHAGARLRAALEEPGAEGAAVAHLLPARPHRDPGHVRAAVRAHHATRGEHGRRTHRDSRAAVARLRLHGTVRPRDGGRRRRYGALAADRRRAHRARADRDPGAGLRIHALDGRVHRHGHSRSSLSFRHTEE